MTDDVNAGSQALLEAGVNELIVCDTHHGGGNLFADKMLEDPRITYQHHRLGVEDGKRRWMPGLNETVTGFMLPGHHAMAGTPGSFLPHTWNFDWADFRINGQPVGEMGIEACFAGHWDIPVIFASGDAAACAEAEQLFPGIVTSVVKWGTSWREQCHGMDPKAAHLQNAAKMAEAIAKLKRGECRPYKPTSADDRPRADVDHRSSGQSGAKAAGVADRRSHRGVTCRQAMRCRPVAAGRWFGHAAQGMSARRTGRLYNVIPDGRPISPRNRA